MHRFGRDVRPAQASRKLKREQKHEELGRKQLKRELSDAETELRDARMDDDIGDDLLRLVFTACHPVLSTEARVALTGLVPESWRAPGTRLRISLTAVIEDTSGRIAYWALKHAPDKPDFHHAAGFILEV